MLRILATIGLRYETELEQLRYVLAKLREMCLAHPKVDNDTLPLSTETEGGEQPCEPESPKNP